MAAVTSFTSSNVALPLLRNGLLSWSPALRPEGAKLAKALAGVDPRVFALAVEAEGRRRLDAFLTGLERYRRHPYRRDVDYPAPVWRRGSTQLYDYGATGGRPVPALFVPSLVNRAYILDLSSRRSFIRWLQRRGVWPFLLDWTAPGDVERRYGLSQYIIQRLEAALDAVIELTGEKPVLVGYCMGGLLALAAAQRRQDDIRGLALLATPWDFHVTRPAQAQAMEDMLRVLAPMLDTAGELPVDAIQALFTSLDPALVERKFSAFAALDPRSDKAEAFVALEDWVNDGVPLAAPVARECLGGWYGANAPARGAWRIAGEAVQPSAVRLPSVVVVPANDRIVPPESAIPLGAALPDAVTLRPAAGHVGMMVGNGVEKTVWQPLVDWFSALPP